MFGLQRSVHKESIFTRGKNVEQKKQKRKKYLEKRIRNDNGTAREKVYKRKADKWETRRPRKDRRTVFYKRKAMKPTQVPTMTLFHFFRITGPA